MKRTRSENLSEHLLNADESLLANAYEVDDAEKLKQYIREKTKKPFYKTARFRKASVIAACFLLLVGLWLTAPAFFFSANKSAPTNDRAPESTTERPSPPWNKTEEICIESLDMLNYYAAMKLLDEGKQKTAAVKPYGFTLISDIGYDNPLYAEKPASGGEDTENVYVFELGETFTVTRAIFFQIEIKNGSGFLASRIGTGIADVVITENSLEPMITFKNGDRYYSCFEDTRPDGETLYSTEKYIDGFSIVKNSEQENYSFSVVYENFNLEYEGVSAESVICESYKNGGSSPDGEMAVVGRTYVAAYGGEFTVRELEEYFRSRSE